MGSEKLPQWEETRRNESVLQGMGRSRIICNTIVREVSRQKSRQGNKLPKVDCKQMV